MWKCIIKTDTLILGTDYLTMNNHLFVRLRKNFEYITGLPVYILANKVFLSCSVVLYVHYMSIHSSRDLSWNNYLSDRFRDNSICTYIYMCVYYVFQLQSYKVLLSCCTMSITCLFTDQGIYQRNNYLSDRFRENSTDMYHYDQCWT